MYANEQAYTKEANYARLKENTKLKSRILAPTGGDCTDLQSENVTLPDVNARHDPCL